MTSLADLIATLEQRHEAQMAELRDLRAEVKQLLIMAPMLERAISDADVRLSLDRQLAGERRALEDLKTWPEARG